MPNVLAIPRLGSVAALAPLARRNAIGTSAASNNSDFTPVTAERDRVARDRL